MTEKVVERAGQQLVVELTLARGGAQERLRLRIDDRPDRQGQLVSVARIVDGVQVPYGIAAYERLMSTLLPKPDGFEGAIGSTGVVVDVAGRALPAVRTYYRVRVGTGDAVLSTVASRSLPWGQIGSEIVTAEGDIVYKAEILDLGRTAPAAGVVAAGAGDIYDDE